MHYIYIVTNKINNKSYVGQSIDVKKRWRNHILNSKITNKKYAFQNAIEKYGADNFIWQIIDQFESIDAANEAEEFYIGYLQTIAPNGYNIQKGGTNRKPAESTKNKIREKLKIVGSFVGKKGKDHPNFGRKPSIEKRRNQSKKTIR